jgi:hypothetical protein
MVQFGPPLPCRDADSRILVFIVATTVILMVVVLVLVLVGCAITWADDRLPALELPEVGPVVLTRWNLCLIDTFADSVYKIIPKILGRLGVLWPK